MPYLQIYEFNHLEWNFQNIEINIDNNLESIQFSSIDWNIYIKRNDKVYFRHIFETDNNIYIFLNNESISKKNNNNNNNDNNTKIEEQENVLSFSKNEINSSNIGNQILILNLREQSLDSILGEHENLVELSFDEPISDSLLRILDTLDVKFSTLYNYSTPIYTLDTPKDSKYIQTFKNLKKEDRRLFNMIEDFGDTLKLLEKECNFAREKLNLFSSNEFISHFEREIKHFNMFISNIKLSTDNITKEFLTEHVEIFLQFREFIRLFYWKIGSIEDIQSPIFLKNSLENSTDIEPLLLENASCLSSSTSSYFFQDGNNSVYHELFDQCRDIYGLAKKLLNSIDTNTNPVIDTLVSTYKSILEKASPILMLSNDYNSIVQHHQQIQSPRIMIPILDYINLLSKLLSLNQQQIIELNLVSLKDHLQEFIKCILGILRCVMSNCPAAGSQVHSTCSSPAIPYPYATPRSVSSYNLCHAVSADSPMLMTSLSSSKLNNTLRRRRLNHLNYAASQLLPPFETNESKLKINHNTLLRNSNSNNNLKNSINNNNNSNNNNRISLINSRSDTIELLKTLSESKDNNHQEHNETSLQQSLNHYLQCYPNLTLEEVDNSIWFEKSSEENVVYDESPLRPGHSQSIKAGTLNQLIIRLTNECNQELKFTKTFISTYRSFTNPELLLSKLIQRYYIPDLNTNTTNNFRNKVQRPVQLRVLNVIKMWICQRASEFTMEMTKTLTLFLYFAKENSHGQISDVILKNFHAKPKRRVDVFSDALSGGTPDRMPTPKIFWKKYSTEFILALNEMEVAKQMTILDFDTFQSIDETELFDGRWTKPDYQHLSPNVMSMIDRFNDISAFVSYSILNEIEMSKRVKLMVKFIQLCKCLLKLGNFNSLIATLSGMSTSSIYRLSKTYHNIPKKYKKQLQKLGELIDAHFSHKHYREAIHNRCPPLIPYLGIHLQDLVFIEEGNPNFTTDRELINFKKRELVYQVIALFKQYQQQPYSITPKPQILQFLREFPKVPANKRSHDDSLYQMSLKLEPRISLSSSESSIPV